MTENQINNTVTIPEGSNVRTIRCTPMLRYRSPSNHACAHGVKILQQAWQCLEDQSIEWRDVPVEIG